MAHRSVRSTIKKEMNHFGMKREYRHKNYYNGRMNYRVPELFLYTLFIYFINVVQLY